MNSHLYQLILLALAIVACDTTFEYNPERNYEDRQREILSQLILAKDSTTVLLPEGHFLFDKSLILEGKTSVTLKGAGIDKTVLSFKDQQEGAEGIRVANSTNITLKDFTIEDAAGDNIKVTDVSGFTIENVKSGWTGTVDENNGAYGIYPVLSTNVVVRGCEVYGASDAGIYVGQSDTVLIEDNTVYWNVAGIESENSNEVIVRNNKAYENTGGILVFDLPGLTQYGSNIDVYNNHIENNNTPNFAPEGNMVSITPPGTGVLVLATQGVTVRENVIHNNRTIGVGIVSYSILESLGQEENTGGGGSREELEAQHQADEDYNPYVGNIRVQNNQFANSHLLPDLNNDFGKLFLFKFWFDIPFIAWDGLESPDYKLADGSINPDYRICVSEAEGVQAVNLDIGNELANLEINPDIFNCD